MRLDPGPVPPRVNTVLPVVANQTERERIEGATKNAPCSNCRRVIKRYGNVSNTNRTK